MKTLEEIKKETYEQIQRLVSKYPWEGSKELFTSEMIYLTELPNKAIRIIVDRAYDPELKTYDYDKIAEGVLEYLNINILSSR